MKIEIPEFKRCCFCLPLRYALLVWSYLLLIPLTDNAFEFVMAFKYFIDNQHHWTQITLTTVGFLLLVINIGLTFLLIVAAHKKCIRLFKVYYKFGLFATIATFTCELLWLVNNIASIAYSRNGSLTVTMWKDMILWLIFEVANFGVKLYVLGMVRSEILKLDKNYRFQFFNIAAEAENTYYEPNSITIELGNASGKTETNKSMEEKHGNEEIKNNVPTYIETCDQNPKHFEFYK